MRKTGCAMRNNLEYGSLPDEFGASGSDTAATGDYLLPPEYYPLPREFPVNPPTDPDPVLEFPYVPPEHPERVPGFVPEKGTSTMKRLLISILAVTGVSTAAFSLPVSDADVSSEPETSLVENAEDFVDDALDALSDPLQALTDAAADTGDAAP